LTLKLVQVVLFIFIIVDGHFCKNLTSPNAK